MSTQADKIAQRAKNEQKIEDARMAAALDPYGLEARRAAQEGKIMLTNAEGQQAFVDPNNKEVLKIYRGLGFNPGSIATNSTKDRNTAINEAINKTATKIKVDDAIKAAKVSAINNKGVGGIDGTLKDAVTQWQNQNPDSNSNVVTPIQPVVGFDNSANNRAITKIMNDPDGFLQRQVRKNSTSGNIDQFDQDSTGRIIKTGVIPVPKPDNQTFQEWQGVPIHPVTGLPIEAGGDKWPSYTDASEGRTYNNKNFNWNNSSPGQVPSMSQQEIDVLYGRTPSPVQPKQEVDFSGIANWFRKNWGK